MGAIRGFNRRPRRKTRPMGEKRSVLRISKPGKPGTKPKPRVSDGKRHKVITRRIEPKRRPSNA